MTTYNEMKKNYEVIKKFCEVYREKLIAFQCKTVAWNDLCSAEDYRRFFEGLSQEEFVGNMLVGLMNSYAVSLYQEVLDGKKTFEEAFDFGF